MPPTIGANGRADIFWNRILLIRPKGFRFAKAAAGTLVFPGIDGQAAAIEVVIAAGKIVSTALGTIADYLAVTGHSSYCRIVVR